MVCSSDLILVDISSNAKSSLTWDYISIGFACMNYYLRVIV